MLDLEAAFYILGNEILLKRLHNIFRITGQAPRWFSSYLSDHHQSVVADHSRSRALPLKYDVRHGSVLGPMLFTLYTKSLSDVIIHCGCNYHRYTDDTQLEDSAPPSDLPIVLKNMELCISPNKHRMLCNKHQLNDGKTEVFSASRHTLALTSEICSTVGTNKIQFKDPVENLRVQLDSTLSMPYASNIANFEMRKIASVSSCLTKDVTVKLA